MNLHRGIYAEPVTPTAKPLADRRPKPKTFPTRYSFYAKKPAWVKGDLKPGKAFHEVGSGRFCFLAEFLQKPWIVGTIDTGEQK